MAFPSLPPIPADPEMLDLAEGDVGFDYVDRRALQWALLGRMPMVEGEELVHGEPPRGDYAGLAEGCALEPEERPPAPAASNGDRESPRGPVVGEGGIKRRVAPPLSRRLTAPRRAVSRRREPRIGGMWVFLSSAAASVLVLLLSSLAVTQFGDRIEEPALTPPALAPVEAVAEKPVVESAPGLAATRREEF